MSSAETPNTDIGSNQPKRHSLSKKLRFEIFKRDQFICQYCGRHPPETILEIDHIVAVKNGGSSDIDNLVTSCFDCNRGKFTNDLNVLPQSLAEKAAELEEREFQLAGYREVMEQHLRRVADDQWRVADILVPNSSKKGLRRDWLISIKNFNKKLSVYEVMEAAELAYNRISWSENKRFKYFCGVCWNKIRKCQEGENG